MMISNLDPGCAELELTFLASEIDREANNAPPRDSRLICPCMYEYADDDLLILDASGCLGAWL